MSHVPGEDKLTGPENHAALYAAFTDIETIWGTNAYGSTRFDTHGYLANRRPYPETVEVLKYRHPQLQFKITMEGNETVIAFRTIGSKAWWRGRNV